MERPSTFPLPPPPQDNQSVFLSPSQIGENENAISVLKLGLQSLGKMIEVIIDHHRHFTRYGLRFGIKNGARELRESSRNAIQQAAQRLTLLDLLLHHHRARLGPPGWTRHPKLQSDLPNLHKNSRRFDPQNPSISFSRPSDLRVCGNGLPVSGSHPINSK